MKTAECQLQSDFQNIETDLVQRPKLLCSNGQDGKHPGSTQEKSLA